VWFFFRNDLHLVASSPSAPAASSAISARPGAITFINEAVGAYIRGGPTGNERVKIVDIVLGMKSDGELGIALFKGIEENDGGGQYYEFSRLDEYETVVLAQAGLKHFYLRDDVTNERYFVEAASLEVRKDGFLGFRTIEGQTNAGERFSLNTPGECCGPVVTTKCIKELSDPCSISCPGPANCACGGTGSCMLVMATRCEGGCDVGCGGGKNWVCVGPVSNCHCQAP
jgi:hypothetical protein